jgi:hypothetical protein
LVALSLLLATNIQADSPAWWTEYGATSDTPADDFAVLNQGQLKNLAIAAYKNLGDRLPGGAEDYLHDHVAAFYDLATDSPKVDPEHPADDYSAANLGQLKALALPFYNCLVDAGYIYQDATSGNWIYPWLDGDFREHTEKYPWERSSASGATANYAAANIGQAKFLFSFDPGAIDLNSDPGGNGIPDWWERRFFGGTVDVDLGDDEDNDGYSNLKSGN